MNVASLVSTVSLALTQCWKDVYVQNESDGVLPEFCFKLPEFFPNGISPFAHT